MSVVPFTNAAQSGWQLLKRLATVTPRNPKFTVGVDIGSSAVKVVALGGRKTSGGSPLLGQHHVPLTGSSDTEISSAITEAVRTLHLPVKTVTLSVSGQSVILRVVEMPTMKPEELAQALPLEAQRYLPFNIQDVVLDGAMLESADGHKMWVLIVACKRELIEQRIHVVQQAGFAPGCMDVDALALANAFLQQTTNRTPSGIHAVINVGAEWTNLAVLKGEVPDLVRDIPWGATKLIHQVAEQLRRDNSEVAAQLHHPTPLPTELQEALKAACESVTADLQLSFDFFESCFGMSPTQLLVSGGLSQCAGFVEGLRAHLTQPISPWSPVSGLSGEYTIAYGLALRT